MWQGAGFLPYYRFRLAEPNLFLDKYLRFTKEGVQTGLRIDLSRNFRSRAEILDGVNFIFKQIMGTKVGEIEYNHEAELVKGSGYPNHPEEPFPVEVIMIDQADISPDEEERELSNDHFDQVQLEQSKLEARWMARKIRDLIDGQAPIYDLKTKSTRPIRYQDIVILTRSLSWAPEIMDELKHAGIPVYADLSTGYFDATEIATMVSLLNVIDNPDQDIPLAAVLRSPIVGLSEEELARIRIQTTKGSFYEAVNQFVSTEHEHNFQHTRKEVSQFLKMLQTWRSLARSGALADLIWQLYRDTGFYEFVGGLPGGKQRQANLRALYDRARQYEETSFRGLFRFLRFIEKLRERGNDLGAARALGEQEDVVRIMTIHSSKGLEFPVVFVGGIARKFNMMDIHSSYLFDKDFGFASKYVNPEKRLTYSSLPQQALKRKKKNELLAEEMRVLYVAMTRAKEKLFLVGSVKDAEKLTKKWTAVQDHPYWLLSNYHRANAVSYLDWIGIALARHPDGPMNRTAIVEDVANHPSRWQVTIFPKTQFEQGHESQVDNDIHWVDFVKTGKPVPIQSDKYSEIAGKFNWTYHYSSATTKMSKQSVTEIKRLLEMEDEASFPVSQSSRSIVYERPKFMRAAAKGLSPTERGTAMHTVMQHLPLHKKPTIQSIESLLEEMIDHEKLTVEQAEVIEKEQILQFFETEIGKRMLGAKKVSREIPFTIGIPAVDLYSDWDGKDEKVIVQGIIDCVIEEDAGILLLDYKTDTILGKFPGGFQQAKSTLAKRYKTQLTFYERAITEIWRKSVTEKYLYFFDSGDFLKLS